MNRPTALAVTIAKLVVAVVLLVPAMVIAASHGPRLDPPAAGDYRKPKEPFVIRLAAPNNPAVSHLALELDNIDVTSRVEPVDDTYTIFRFEPYTPLNPGSHVLRLVEYMTNGAIVELARWTVKVRVVKTSITPALNIGVSARIDEKPSSDKPDRLAAQGSGHVDAYTDNGSRRWAATADLLIDSTTPDGMPRAVDLGEFLVTRDSEHSNLSIGHHFPGAIQGVAEGNLVFDGYARRGISGTVHAGPLGSAITLFGLRTEQIRGFEHGFGIGDDNNRISGGMFRLQPFSNVALSLGYVSGGSTVVGFGTGAGYFGLSGNAANLVIDTTWFDRRLGLRAEAAHSSIDLGGGFGELSDQAYALNLTFRPNKGLHLGEHLLRWDLSLGYADIGSAFRSIGNLGQIANIREYRVGFNANTETLSLNLTGSRTRDNVDSAIYPSTRADTVNAVLGWQPKVSEDFGGWLFAQPYFSLSLLGDHRETVDMPVGSLAYPVDMTTRGYLLNASFAHPFGRWSISGGTTTVDDDTDLYPDMRYDTLALNVGFQVGKRYNLTTGLAYDVATDRSSGVSTRTASLQLSQYWVIIPERLDLQLGASLNHIEASNDSLDTEQLAGNLRLSWYQGPFTFWLAGNYSEVDSRMIYYFSGLPFLYQQDDETYRVLIGVSYSLGGISFP